MRILVGAKAPDKSADIPDILPDVLDNVSISLVPEPFDIPIIEPVIFDRVLEVLPDDDPTPNDV